MTTDGEFEAVNQFVRQCVDRIEGTPYLAPGTVWTFLGELAHGQAKRGALAVPSIAGSVRWIWSTEKTAAEQHTAIAELFTKSGIATVADDQLQFSDTTRHYLMARHIVQYHDKGPPLLSLGKPKHLQARPEWSEQDMELTRFLVILWWQKAKAKVVRHLRKLLRDPYPNIFFVADLCRRGLLEGSDLRERTIAALCKEVSTAKRPEEAWRAMVETLYSIDPAAAVTELENAVRSPTRHMTVLRQLPAVIELTRYDPALGAANLVYLADHLWGDPDDQVTVAIGIAEIDPALGTRTLERLARDPSLGESRVEAALQVDLPKLWRELIEDSALSDGGRGRLLVRLLDRDLDEALAVVQAFVATTHEERTPLRIAELIKDYDRDLAWDVAYEFSCTTKRKASSAVRLEGILFLGRLDPSQAESLLTEFSAWSAMDNKVRLQAAIMVWKQFSSSAALVALVEDAQLPDEIRIEAVKIVYPKLTQRRRIELYSTIARTADDDDTAFTIARMVKDMATDAGERLMADLSQRDMPFKSQLQAAQEARMHGRPALMNWTHRTRPAPMRFAAATVLGLIDSMTADRIINELAHNHGNGEVRIQAAQALPKRKLLPCLTEAVRDRQEHEDVRCAAAMLVMQEDNDLGRQLLTELAEARISRRMRDHILRLLQQ